MNKRLIVAVVFALIVVVELFFFLTEPTPTTFEPSSSGTLFGGTTTVNYEAKAAKDRAYLVVIGATVVIGALVTFSVPQNKK